MIKILFLCLRHTTHIHIFVSQGLKKYLSSFPLFSWCYLLYYYLFAILPSSIILFPVLTLTQINSFYTIVIFFYSIILLHIYYFLLFVWKNHRVCIVYRDILLKIYLTNRHFLQNLLYFIRQWIISLGRVISVWTSYYLFSFISLNSVFKQSNI